MKVLLSHLGCKLNQAELEAIGRQFQAAGHELVDSLLEADLHVLNTCTVTHLAARDSRKLARRGRRVNPHLRTVLTGCYVESDAAEAASLSGVDLVVSNRDKDQLVDRVQAAFPAATAALDGAGSEVPVPYVPLEFGRSRALIKIEDGCNMPCSFCVIPSTRGPQRSRPLPQVLDEVRELTAAGYQEVVVTGVQISAYRWQGHGLYDLTRALIEQTEIPRLRLTSIAPWQFDRRLLDLFASDRLCRHVHLSLQSGCSETLRRMRRPYAAADFATLVSRLRERIASLAITTDVIVGFPGETEVEFDRSRRFVERMAFARVHAFPFSARSGTEAATLPEQVTADVKRRRMAQMLAVAQASRSQFEARHQRTRARVLWEYRRQGAWYGTTDNYLRVVLESDEDLAHRITPVELAEPLNSVLSCAPLTA